MSRGGYKRNNSGEVLSEYGYGHNGGANSVPLGDIGIPLQGDFTMPNFGEVIDPSEKSYIAGYGAPPPYFQQFGAYLGN